MILFETDKKPLLFLLDLIENRALALPDFQRSFVWDPEATRELVVSVVRSFPAGTLLQMDGGSNVFAPRAFEEAPALTRAPSHLILDGQQRLTSLYQAFFGRGTHRFFLNIGELIEGKTVDDAVEVYAVKRAQRLEPLPQQADALLLPLLRIREFADWKDDVLECLEERHDDMRKLRKQLNEVEKAFVKPVELYQFPVTTLAATTPPEAVCAIFETLNRTGVKLSVFELLTARAFAREVRLRDMWADTQRDRGVLTEFRVDPYYVLQTIALIARGNPQRSTVLALDVEEITQHWDEAVEGIVGALTLLRDECGVLTPKWLPYGTMLITMARAWRCVTAASGPAVGARRVKLARWFWCSSFAQAYENSGNSVSERDAPQLEQWLEGGDAPAVVEDFAFNSSRWYEITVRQRALYRASIALLMRHSPLDFHEGMPLTRPIIDGKDVDDHHVFPKAFLKASGFGQAIDSVLNHTLIDRRTNIRIGGRAPSSYLQEMRAELEDKLTHILESHGLPADADGPLFRDDFDGFSRWRLRYLEQELAEVTGGAVGEGVEAVEDEPAPDGTDALPESAVGRDELRAFIEEFDPGQSRALIEAFVDEVESWPGAYVWVGRGNTPAWRLAHFARAGSRLGAFAKLHPRLARVSLRLRAEDLPPDSPANVLNRKGPYQVRVPLNSEEQLTHAIELAQMAYDRALL